MQDFFCCCFRQNRVEVIDEERKKIEKDLEFLKGELENMRQEVEGKQLEKLEVEVYKEVMNDPLYKHLAMKTETLMIDFPKKEWNDEMSKGCKKVTFQDSDDDDVFNDNQIIMNTKDSTKERLQSNAESEREWVQSVSTSVIPSPNTKLKLEAASY